MLKLPKVVSKRKKRLGLGYGSGKGGHTVGRGQKGQKARGNMAILFEGMKVKKSLIKRLPLRRGKDRLKSHPKPLVVKVELLNLLPAGSKVNLGLLIKSGILRKDDAESYGAKVLGKGKVTKKLVIEMPISKGAADQIKKAGGSISEEKPTNEAESKKS
jgi:large subunit ribosomal protein L15